MCDLFVCSNTKQSYHRHISGLTTNSLLKLAWNLISQNKGTVQIEDIFGQGAEFDIWS